MARKVRVSPRDGKRKRGAQAGGRDFANVEACESRMRELGFDVVEVSVLEPDARFDPWANARDIVGVQGAGMMNMIMMPRGSNCTEIAGMSGLANGRRLYWTIRCALAAGRRVRGIAGVLDPQNRRSSTLTGWKLGCRPRPVRGRPLDREPGDERTGRQAVPCDLRRNGAATVLPSPETIP